MHSNVRYFFWDDKFDILCHEIILSANTQGITIKLKLLQNELELTSNSISLPSVHIHMIPNCIVLGSTLILFTLLQNNYI